MLDTVFFFWKALEQALVKLEIMLKQASPQQPALTAVSPGLRKRPDEMTSRGPFRS